MAGMENNVLLLGNKESVFVSNFALEIEKQGFTAHIFDPGRFGIYNSGGTLIRNFSTPPAILDHIPKLGYRFKLVLIRRMLRKLHGRYRICHIHYNLKLYADIAESVQKIADKLVVSIWGSDFYRKSPSVRKAQEKIYDRADLIALLTPQTMRAFNEYYSGRYKQKTTILRLGLKPLEYIDDIADETPQTMKTQFGIDPEATVIACGYNGTPAQNHEQMIESFQKIHNKLPKNCRFLFPMTYGEDTHKHSIEEMLEKSGLAYKIISGFIADPDIARLRKMTDIFINIQKTDHLSGSLLEHLYAGSIVISGRWLPYDILDEKGVFQLYVDSPVEVGEKLLEAVSNLESYKTKAMDNSSIVGDISRWSVNIVKWAQAYKTLFE